jgi:C-terminal processing protease CtpA/Prc
MFETFKGARGIIFDMRGYPQGTAWHIAPRLCQKPNTVGALFERPVAMWPHGSAESGEQRVTYMFEQIIPPLSGWVYTNRTVMLIDERTISQAEHTGLFFEAANGTTFVGSRSNGANGDVTNIVLPGGIRVGFSGQAVKHSDGRQLQRIGLIPHVEVKPTIQGIRSGRDEVLERAIDHLMREFRH